MSDTIIKLTKQQEDQIVSIKDEWVKFILKDGDSIDPDAIEKYGKWMYTIKDFPEPKVHIVSSPFAAQALANKLAGNKKFKWYQFSQESINNSGGWAVYVDMFIKLGIFKSEEFENYCKFLRAGAFMSLTFDTDLIVCRKPLYIHLNDKFQYHSDSSPAMEWSDGFKLYYLNNVQVPDTIVLTSPHELDPELVLRSDNAEVRREIIRKMTINRFIQKAGMTIVDEWKRNADTEYKLGTLSIPNMRIKPTYLIMRNPSIGVFYAEGVPPECKTVREALAWRDEETEYIEPDVLT